MARPNNTILNKNRNRNRTSGTNSTIDNHEPSNNNKNAFTKNPFTKNKYNKNYGGSENFGKT